MLRSFRLPVSFFVLSWCVVAFLLISVGGSRQAIGNTTVSGVDCLVEPSVVAEIGFSVPGILKEINFDRSDYVQTGSVLARLESGVEEASLAYAEAVAKIDTAVELRQLNAAYGMRTRDRNEQLYRRASVSGQTIDQVRTEAAIAELQVRQELENRELARIEETRARAVLDRRVLTSEYDAAVVRRLKSVGEYVDGEPVFKLAKLDPLHVEVVVPVTELGRISTGMKGRVQLTAPGFDDRALEATVRRIDPVADAASGTFGVQLELPNPDLSIPSGVRCRIDLVNN